jgi:hypothetical protein
MAPTLPGGGTRSARRTNVRRCTVDGMLQHCQAGPAPGIHPPGTPGLRSCEPAHLVGWGRLPAQKRAIPGPRAHSGCLRVPSQQMARCSKIFVGLCLLGLLALSSLQPADAKASRGSRVKGKGAAIKRSKVSAVAVPQGRHATPAPDASADLIRCLSPLSLCRCPPEV